VHARSAKSCIRRSITYEHVKHSHMIPGQPVPESIGSSRQQRSRRACQTNGSVSLPVVGESDGKIIYCERKCDQQHARSNTRHVGEAAAVSSDLERSQHHDLRPRICYGRCDVSHTNGPVVLRVAGPGLIPPKNGQLLDRTGSRLEVYRDGIYSHDYRRMTTNISEDHDRIRDLQKNLEQAIKRWGAAEKNNHEFNTLAPVANELVNAYQELENRRTQAMNALLRQCGGWAAGGLTVIVLACVLFAGWSPWLLIVLFALAVASFFLVMGGRR
jgi:hypothetical protein